MVSRMMEQSRDSLIIILFVLLDSHLTLEAPFIRVTVTVPFFSLRIYAICYMYLEPYN